MDQKPPPPPPPSAPPPLGPKQGVPLRAGQPQGIPIQPAQPQQRPVNLAPPRVVQPPRPGGPPQPGQQQVAFKPAVSGGQHTAFQPAQQQPFQPAQQQQHAFQPAHPPFPAGQPVEVHAVQAQQVTAVQAQHVAGRAPAQPKHSVTSGAGQPGVASPNDPNLKPIERLFALMAQYDASDLHLKAGNPVVMRVRGEMRALQANPISSEEIYSLLRDIATPEQIQLYDETGDLDFAHMLPDQAGSRFRLNIFRANRTHTLVARRINTSIPNFEQLNLPADSLTRILDADDGLIVLAGVTGSGKSTTIAGMIDYINHHHAAHIVTVEDPIEFQFTNKRSFISQREIGVDCKNWKAAIRTLVRQDPDVILIGEMRDQETFEFGLIAAETGHLVFGTLHAGTVPQSIGRILGLFPSEKHPQLRQGLSFNLRSIICQKLVPSPQFGRIPINEILIATPIVKKFLAEGEDLKLTGVMAGGREDGMMTFDQCLLDRSKKGLVEESVALQFATNPEQFKLALQGIELGGSKGRISG